MKLSRRYAIACLLTAVLVAGTAVRIEAASKPRKVLVVTTTTGFRHSSIETAEKVIERLGKESGAFTVEFARVTPPKEPRKPSAPKDTGDAEKLKADTEKYNAAMEKYKPEQERYQEELKKYSAEQKQVLAEKMSAQALKNYDGVIFANTTGDLPLPDPQAFVDWVKAGGGFAGMHSASDTFHGFKPFVEMIGGEFLSHGAQATVDCLNEDRKHDACKHLPESWTVHDEIYILKSYNRETVHGLLSLDKEPNKKTEGHYPISWCKEFGKGRVFYTSLGHREDIWDEQWGGNNRKNSPEISKAYQQHILAGIQWALGDAKGSGKPQKQK